jgi:hypothetical protein
VEGTKESVVEGLTQYRECVERIRSGWNGFIERRGQRLEPHPNLPGSPSEDAAKAVLHDLFTSVLDWPLSGVCGEVSDADIVLTDHGIRWLIVEAKRPGALAWDRRAAERALDQAARYASKQGVDRVAISDACMLYAADLAEGGMQDRIFVSLFCAQPATDLWWISVQGIWRPRADRANAELALLPDKAVVTPPGAGERDPGATLFHHRYSKLPACCFAYVGDYSDTHTWKLPYLAADGTVDAKRLPKAIQCLLSSYRGKRVEGIPERAIPSVLRRLARAAEQAGHLPTQASGTASVYRQLAGVLKQFDPQGGDDQGCA